MLCVPAASATVIDAEPATRVCAEPSNVGPSKNDTVPVAVPAAAGFTAAVKVTGCAANGATLFELKVTVVADCTPVPASRTVCGTTPVPLKTTEPAAGPGATGKKATFCVQLAPGASVTGTDAQEPPATAVNAPVKAIDETEREALPVFASVTPCAALGTPTPSFAKVSKARPVARMRSFNLSAMAKLPAASRATDFGEFRIAPVAGPPSPPKP